MFIRIVATTPTIPAAETPLYKLAAATEAPFKDATRRVPRNGRCRWSPRSARWAANSNPWIVEACSCGDNRPAESLMEAVPLGTYSTRVSFKTSKSSKTNLPVRCSGCGEVGPGWKGHAPTHASTTRFRGATRRLGIGIDRNRQESAVSRQDDASIARLGTRRMPRNMSRRV